MYRGRRSIPIGSTASGKIPTVLLADENSQASSTTPNTNLKKNFDNGNGFLNGFSSSGADSPSTPADSITKTIWMQQSSSDDSSLTLFDPDLISTFRKAMDEISPRDSMEPVSEVCQGSTGSKSGEDEKGTPGKSFRLRSSSIQARVRFIPCQNCDGSCKVLQKRKVRVFSSGVSSVMKTGLIRCPVCC
jgi:hypothetical protein